MVANAAVVAVVMCSESHVDLQVSEGPYLFDNMETEPGPKSPEPGEVSYLPILSDIGDTDFKGPLADVRRCVGPPVSVGGIISEVRTGRDLWNAIENKHEGPPCEYGARIRIQ